MSLYQRFVHWLGNSWLGNSRLGMHMQARGRYLAPALIALAAAFPLVIDNPYLAQILILIMIYATVGSAWNILGGYAGQLSLGHAAYFGAGAYTLALVTTTLKLSPWIGLALAPAVAMLFALAIGGVCFRLRGPYFTLATIAMTEVLKLLALNMRGLTSGAVGIVVPPIFPGISKIPYYYLILAITLLSLAVTRWMSQAKLGYYLQAIREDEDTAESIGIDSTKYKLIALLISAALTGLAGAFFASYIFFIDPDMVFSVGRSVEIVLYAIIGGLGTVAGPLIGAVTLGLASEVFRNIFKQAHLLIYGLLLIFVILFLPDGLLGGIRRLMRRRLPPAPGPQG
jgi:branched-chain amino acid transport system permease protein